MDLSLDDIIKKNNQGSQKPRARIQIGGRRDGGSRDKPLQSNNRAGPPRRPSLRADEPKVQFPTNKPAAVTDARLRIIQKNRMRLTDARDKLSQLAKQTDARTKITGRKPVGNQASVRRDGERVNRTNSGGRPRPEPVILQRSIRNNIAGRRGGNNITGRRGGNNITSRRGGNNITSRRGGNNITSRRGGNNTASRTGGSNTTSRRGGVNTTSRRGGDNTASRRGGVNTPSRRGGLPSYTMRVHPSDDRRGRMNEDASSLIRCTINRSEMDFRQQSSMHEDDEDMPLPARSHNLSSIKVVAQNEYTHYEPDYFPSKAQPVFMQYDQPVFTRQMESPRDMSLGRNGQRMSMQMRSRLDTPSRPSPPYYVVSPPAQQSPPPTLGHRIVVSNLHSSVTHEDIKELFEDIGPLLTSRLVRAGTAEVIYKLHKDAKKAVEAYHNRQLDGQPMKCLLVNPRSPPASSGVLRSSNMAVPTKFPISSKSMVVPDLSAIHKALFTSK